MSKDITRIVDRVQRTINRLLYMFRGQPNAEATAASYGAQFQAIEDMMVDIYLKTTMENSEGIQLDKLGEIVDEKRGSKNDDNYRAALYARVTLNRSNGRNEDVIFSIKSIQDAGVRVREIGEVTIKVRLLGAIDPSIDPETFDEALQRIKGGGVNAKFQYSEYDEDNTFRWADGSVTEATTTAGWSNVAKTNGGKWSDVV